MKRLIAYFVSGVRTGSFFYLALLLLGQLFPQLIYPKVSVGNILALFMMSGLMGMLSWILEELDRMSPELSQILDWVEQLGEVDTSEVEPMTAVIPNKLRLRDDVVDADPLTGGGKRDDVLANAPVAEHGFFGVPKVIE